MYFAANAMVYGSVFLASSWEPFRVAIAAISTFFYFRRSLVQKNKELLDMISWDEKVYPVQNLTRAKPCSKNKGVINKDGS